MPCRVPATSRRAENVRQCERVRPRGSERLYTRLLRGAARKVAAGNVRARATKSTEAWTERRRRRRRCRCRTPNTPTCRRKPSTRSRRDLSLCLIIARPAVAYLVDRPIDRSSRYGDDGGTSDRRIVDRRAIATDHADGINDGMPDRRCRRFLRRKLSS